LDFPALSAKDEEKAQKRAHKVAAHHGETSGTARKALKNQMSIQTSFDRAHVWDINSGSAKKITQLIGEMVEDFPDGRRLGIPEANGTFGSLLFTAKPVSF
jgi:hypothetical protein